jgi:ferric-dicitrate binding protein FerR (iron transport regulator)
VYISTSDGAPRQWNAIQAGDSVVDGSVKLVKTGKGEITYRSVNNKDTGSYHAVATPRTQTQEVNFIDGSAVLLEPASVIRYPVFEAEKKVLSVAGQAVFTAAKALSVASTVLNAGNETVQDSVFTLKSPDESCKCEGRIWVTMDAKTGVITAYTNPGYRVEVIMTDRGVTLTAVRDHPHTEGKDGKK